MKKTIFFILLVLGVIVLWKGKEIIPLNLQKNFLNITHDVKEAILPHSGSDTLVIEFTDGEDLLAKLRAVETGRKIEIREKEGQSTRYVDTGISCKDDAAKAAYMEKANREREQLNKDINAELKRIQQTP
ncbi:MAG: hypothetical protein A2Y65_01245 [Deltaproteobacteria bacterium RBG_13_52_11]|jgi:hypothetical protein|nr:MAG: hypothetical protein A2Y65_01245 [Deltaproteobacteria bacterium RBG_13_52_11]